MQKAPSRQLTSSYPTHMRILLILPLLAACASPDAPSHLPNPLLLPFAAIGNSISNATYNARRTKVSRFVVQNFEALKAELPSPNQPLLTKAMSIARVPVVNRPALLADLRTNPQIYNTYDPEPLVIALMINGR